MGEATDIQFPVVGIGASAGGLEAVRRFLQLIPEKSGMAYVFVQHLSPQHESALPEILEKSAKIPVHKISDNILIEKDNLYIIPENKIVTAFDGALKLTPLREQRHKIKVIDVFFSSLAVVHQSFAVGVVLSGTLDDGTLGLQVIKTYGGLTFAQDTESAAFEGMPRNAVEKGAVDFVLPPEKIAEKLLTINHYFLEDDIKTVTAAPVRQHPPETFKQILTVLRVRSGIDFTYYKEATIKRRLVRRMALSLIESAAEYLEFLRENKAEQDALCNDMLISVTQFFRDPATFDLLCSSIFPSIVKQKSASESLRIWVAGCATGQEAYSMAMSVQDHLSGNSAGLKIQIFATDISERAIAKARTGIYKPSELEGLSASRLQRFFTKLDGHYQVNKEIRDMCIFAHHNLLKDPPFSKMDLVSCRNVLIYLEPVLQKRALTSFHYSLNDQGFLVLGKSESVMGAPDQYTMYQPNERIFRKKGNRWHHMHVVSAASEDNLKRFDVTVTKEDTKEDVFKLADSIILSEHAPPGFLVNQHFDIIQFRGKTDAWVDLSPGEATFNVLKWVRGGLAFELRSLLHQANKTNAAARKDSILFKSDDREQYIDLVVKPVPGLADPHYLILFENKKAKGPELPNLGPKRKKGKATESLLLENEQLRKDLLQARSDMRGITEEQEALNEELQSANQELLSGSEELRSINEELETSTEELQSTNEEIIIVNTELIDRNEQLNSARTYTEAIVNTIRDPLVILDKDLRIRRVTEGFCQEFKVTEKEAEGAYFYELGNKQWDIPMLRELLESVLPSKKVLTDFEITHLFPTIGRKILRLNTRQLDNISGEQLILLAIEDITAKRKVEEGLAEVEVLFAESKERLRLAVEATGLGTWEYSPITMELICDNRCKEMFGFLPSANIDLRQFMEMIHPDDKNSVQESFQMVLTGANDGEYEREFRTVETKEKKSKWIKFKGKVYFNEGAVAFRFVGTSLDVTAQKIMDNATKELLQKKDDFISIASHELKTPITSLKATLQLLDRRKSDLSDTAFPHLIELANRSLNKVNDLVEDLLDVNKFTHGELNLNRKRFVLSKMIDGCCSHIRIEGNYHIRTEGNVEQEVYADPVRIEQVVVNFINNSIKYAPESKEIIVRITNEESMVKVSVVDKGPGIHPHQIPHLFERYYQIDGSRYSGLGMGLYICSEIIKKHGGQIGVNSEMGVGSSFWFTLPL